MLKTITSQVVPIPRRDIDTDMIIPAEFLTCTVKTGLGKYLFAHVRESEKDFELMNRFNNSQIIVARQNFGCGSSREHAIWALYDWGIRVIIAPSFSDIFKNNATKNGILPVILPKKVVESILNNAIYSDSYIVNVDLPDQRVQLPTGNTHRFEIDPYPKTLLLKGLDDLDYLLSYAKEIRLFNNKHSTYE